jgi:hypothetical protein
MGFVFVSRVRNRSFQPTMKPFSGGSVKMRPAAGHISEMSVVVGQASSLPPQGILPAW